MQVLDKGGSQASGSPSATRRALALATPLSVVLALIVPILQFALVFPMVRNVPIWDQWSMMPVWAAYFRGGSVLHQLLLPYSGHANFIPRAIFFGVGLLSHWNLRLEVVLSYIAATITLAALLQMLRDTDKRLLLLAAPVALQVFSLTQFENFMSGYPFGQLLSQMSATLTILLLTRPASRRRHILGAAGCAAIATFSWGAGLAAWFIGGFALVARHRGRRVWIASWSIATIAASAFVWRSAQGAGVNPLAHWPGLLDIGRFALVILGKPIAFFPFPDVRSASILGGLLVIAWVLSLLASVRTGQREIAWRWGLVGLLALSSSLLIALGRFGSGYSQALASHYATAAYPLAISVLVIVASLLLGDPPPIPKAKARFRVTVAFACLALATLQPAVASYRALGIVRSWQGSMTAASKRLKDGTISDAEIRRYFHPNPTLVRRGRKILKQQGLCWFHDKHARAGP